MELENQEILTFVNTVKSLSDYDFTEYSDKSLKRRLMKILHDYQLTTDSLLSSRVEESKEPVNELCWKRLGEPDMPINGTNYKGRLVVSLTDLRKGVAFDEVNPYSTVRQRKPFIQDSYILPLVQEKRGENWSIYRRQPFELTK